MVDRRDGGRKLLADVVRFKREAREARERLEALAPVVAGLQRQAIAFWLGGRLRPEDFHLFIGTEAVLNADGSIDGRRLGRAVDDLLQRRPELATQSRSA